MRGYNNRQGFGHPLFNMVSIQIYIRGNTAIHGWERELLDRLYWLKVITVYFFHFMLEDGESSKV
jgi:hypothetical protein